MDTYTININNNKYTLKSLRANKNWTQKECGKRVGVTPQTWRNWENKKSFPNVPQIKNIEEIFGVEYKDINFF